MYMLTCMLASSGSVQFLTPESRDAADTPMILSEPYSMGITLAGSLLDTMLSSVLQYHCTHIAIH